MEQLLIRQLPDGTKAALRIRAERNGRSVEAEVRTIVAEALARDPLTLVDLLRSDPDVDIELESTRLGVRARTPEL